jgi:hypothetical protein
MEGRRGYFLEGANGIAIVLHHSGRCNVVCSDRPARLEGRGTTVQILCHSAFHLCSSTTRPAHRDSGDCPSPELSGLLAPPASEDQVLMALKKLKLWDLLCGYRGKPRTDIEALIDAAVRLGDQFPATSDMKKFEVNPLMMMPEGKGVYAVDALVSADCGRR